VNTGIIGKICLFKAVTGKGDASSQAKLRQYMGKRRNMRISVSQPSVNHGVRLLALADAHTISRELARMSCSNSDVPRITTKGLIRLVRVETVPVSTALFLKQEMLAVGGDAALNDGAIENKLSTTDIILIGTEYQLSEIALRVQDNLHGLAAVGEAILAALHHYATPPVALHCLSHTLLFGKKTYVMGILNLTPDSFSGDGLHGDIESSLHRAEQMLEEGADILDVGGESTRPGAQAVEEEEEIQRVAPVVRALTARFSAPVSIDTSKSAVAREALDAGAVIINDISGLHFDRDMARVIAEAGAAVVVMHIQGTPRTMQHSPHYTDLMSEVSSFLQESTALALEAGILRERIILDPGFGFGKTVEHNLELLRRLRELTSYGQPILIGTSRKSSIGYILGGAPPEERLEGTAATVAIAIANGADIIRVHDVCQMARVAKMTDAIVRVK